MIHNCNMLFSGTTENNKSYWTININIVFHFLSAPFLKTNSLNCKGSLTLAQTSRLGSVTGIKFLKTENQIKRDINGTEISWVNHWKTD